MRLPRALNPNENPAQFGIFFSANRLKTTFFPTNRLRPYRYPSFPRSLCFNAQKIGKDAFLPSLFLPDNHEKQVIPIRVLC
ncbi:MAG: hypothetical protein BECKG1743D_GA0114223_104232 [Candidatus Kentron sp. G]|nr:MAG: hypothetical protein BECKG1743F_GA0114225_103123 [Candidatus Kentron sp. G]VFM99372.1 MAG: hypothetical protein BECKG1743E_GA0114224_102523 [Candidatus Kentron sp. G]VFN03028.1 MAG: hypothetical protein BECKG1743D_GA0114223_104232 [Candidatus Kentron sp. G]